MRRLFLVVVCGVIVGCGSKDPGMTPSPVVSVQGLWTGTYSVSGCTDSTNSTFCDSIINGARFVSINLTQTGSSVTGSTTFGGVLIPASGSVSATGQLALSGQTVASGTNVSLTGFSATRSGNTLLGGFSVQLLAAGEQATFAGTLVNVTLQ